MIFYSENYNYHSFLGQNFFTSMDPKLGYLSPVAFKSNEAAPLWATVFKDPGLSLVQSYTVAPRIWELGWHLALPQTHYS